MPESIEQPKPITINKDTDHFFLAISKQSEHSFLMLGTYENTKVNHLLCRVGKIPSDNELGCWNIKDLFFSSVPSGLVDEGISRERRHGRLITYHSCDISYEQYLEFIQTLEAMQTADNLFKCYKVMEEQGSTVTLEKTSNIRSPLKQYSVDLNTSIHEFSINNTCRHTAIKLVEHVQKVPVSSLVSQKFFMSLPYTTTLDFGVPSPDTPFYVLPVSPAAYIDLAFKKKRMLETLYGQMEHMLLIEPNSIETQRKFLCLKNYYLELLGPQKEITLDELLVSIRNWKDKNESTLSVLRKTYFFDLFITRQSRTMQLIHEIERDLQKP